jgi:hypothetical protein
MESLFAVAADEVFPIPDLPELLARARGEHRWALVFLALSHPAESYHGYCALSIVFTHSSTAGRLNRTLLAPIFKDGIRGCR